MKTALFDFSLPEALIASTPARPRDSARMLAVSDTLRDLGVRDLPDVLQAGDLLVFNDTRVIPARLIGKRGEAKIELLLHMPAGGMEWQCFARPAKRLKPGDRIVFAGGACEGEVLGKEEDGQVRIRFSLEGDAFAAFLRAHGKMPLPPYMRREAQAQDDADYQTMYAKHDGAVAAPTAGLHFTPALFAALEKAGIERAFVTLHVGAGTFLPVKADDVREHRMHEERYVLPAETVRAIDAAHARGGRVVAVGTTSLRVLESAAEESGALKAGEGATRLFITPGYRFRAVDLLLTNFHLPRSTLFMLVSAFAGLERMKRAYAHAVAQRYRFYSYGDACLLYRAHDA